MSIRRNPYRDLKAGQTGTIWEKSFSEEFDKKGELNAWDKLDAGQQIGVVLDKRARLGNKPLASSELDEGQRRSIYAAAVSDPARGMQMIAEAANEVVYKIVDYVGWTRKILKTQPLAQGEPFRVPKDVDVLGWAVAGDGQSIVSQIRTRYVFPSEWKNTALVEIDIADVLQANWDIFERGVDRAAQKIMQGEDVATYNLLNRVCTTVNSVVHFSTLNLSAFEDVRYEVERWRLNVDQFLINRREVSDAVKVMSKHDVDFVTQREMILSGYIGNIVNARVIVSAGIGVEQVLPPGCIFAVTEGRYLGRLGERLSVQSESYNTLVRQELKKGIAQYELIGMGCGNSRAVAKGSK